MTPPQNYNPNSPHVVYIAANGGLLYSATSSNYHIGRIVIGEFPTMIEADVFVKTNKRFYEKT